MDARHRFIAVLTGQPVDRPPFVRLFGPGSIALRAWEDECPGISGCVDLLLRFEGGSRGWHRTCVNVGIASPDINSVRVVSPDFLVHTDGDGASCIVEPDDNSKHVIAHAVSCREDWNALRDELLDSEDPCRFPPEWRQDVNAYRVRDYPVALTHGGVMRFVRRLMGDANMLSALTTDPSLICEIMDAHTDMVLRLWKKMVARVEFDLVDSWDDFHIDGRFVADEHVLNHIVSNYRRVCHFARENGISIVLAGWHGRVDPVLDELVKAGVSAVYPVDACEGNDLFAIREKYPNLGIIGGLDSIALTKGSKGQRAQLDLARRMIDAGWYIPGLNAHPDSAVRWKVYREFMRQLGKVVRKEGM